MRPNNNHQNNYRNTRAYDDVKVDRWMVKIEGQSYYFIDKEKAIRCYQQFWECSEPVLVPYSRYVRDPNR